MDDTTLLNELRRHLADGEMLRWHGRPAPRRTGIETGTVLGLLGVAGIYAIALNSARPRTPGLGLTELAVLGAVAAFVWFSWVRLQRWRDLYRTIYGITDRRLLVVRAGWNAQVIAESIPRPLVDLRRRYRDRATVRVTTRLYKAEAKGDRDAGWVRECLDMVDILDASRAAALLRGQA